MDILAKLSHSVINTSTGKWALILAKVTKGLDRTSFLHTVVTSKFEYLLLQLGEL